MVGWRWKLSVLSIIGIGLLLLMFLWDIVMYFIGLIVQYMITKTIKIVTKNIPWYF